MAQAKKGRLNYRCPCCFQRDIDMDMFYDEEKQEFLEKRLSRLRELLEMPMGTAAAEELWRSRLSFYILFYEKLTDQLKASKSIAD